jgi:hypothetical protein
MPEINVQDEQGNTHVFPDGSTPEMIAKAMGVKPPSAALVPYSSTNKPNASVSAAPKPFTLPWLKSKFYTAADATADSLPAAGATIGAGIGATGGTFTEPGGGTFLGGVGGAGLGGMAGSAGKHLIRSVLGFDKPADTSTNDIANDISREGVIQGAIEAGSAGLARIAPWLKGTAVGQYERALAPTTKINKAIAADIAPKMVQRGIHGSLESIEDQAGQNINKLSPQLDQAYSDLEANYKRPPIKGLLPAAPTSVPLAPSSAPLSASEEFPGVMQTRDPAIANRAGLPQEAATAVKAPQLPPVAKVPQGGELPGTGKQVLADIESAKGQYMAGGKVVDPAGVKALDDVKEIVNQYGNDVSPTTLRQMRQVFEAPVAKAGGYAGADLSTHYALNAKQAAADSIRHLLNSSPSDIGAINKEISFWLDVQRVTRDSALRRTGQEGGLLKSLAPLATGTAAALSGVHFGAEKGAEAALGTALSTMAFQATRSPAWRTMSSVLKGRFADALARGSVGEASALLGRLGVAVGEAKGMPTQSDPQTSQAPSTQPQLQQ